MAIVDGAYSSSPYRKPSFEGLWSTAPSKCDLAKPAAVMNLPETKAAEIVVVGTLAIDRRGRYAIKADNKGKKLQQ